VNGIAAQVLFVNASQINFVTPGNIPTAGTATIQATCNGTESGTVTAPLAPVAPAAFTESATGAGQASVINANGTVNTAANRATPGNYISVYVTGFGPYAPVGANGLMTLQFPVTATVGGLPATVLYAGAAPTETSGLQQINIGVPAGATAGISVPLVLTVDGVSTPANITVAIN